MTASAQALPTRADPVSAGAGRPATTCARRLAIIGESAGGARALAGCAAANGYAAEVYSDGAAALAGVARSEPAAILLDHALPDGDGVAVCRRLRVFCAAPVILLSARTGLEERISGFAAGADDYVIKPFSHEEVMARVNALTRRAEGRVLTGGLGRVRLDTDGRRAAGPLGWIPLSATEFDILSTLARRPGRVFARTELIDRSGDPLRDVSDRSIDSHVKNIRRKLAAAGVDPSAVASVYGVGYRFDR